MLLERKAGIYAAPVNVFDPYLVGYLSVRSLWCQMAAACSELTIRDLFPSDLLSHADDDPGMVLRILDSYPSELHASKAIINHLLSRMSELVSFEGLRERCGTVDTVGAKMAMLMSRRFAQEPRMSWWAGQMMELALVADVDDDKSKTLGAWMLMTLQERQICVVASTAVNLNLSPRQITSTSSFKGSASPCPASPRIRSGTRGRANW